MCCCVTSTPVYLVATVGFCPVAATSVRQRSLSERCPSVLPGSYGTRTDTPPVSAGGSTFHPEWPHPWLLIPGPIVRAAELNRTTREPSLTRRTGGQTFFAHHFAPEVPITGVAGPGKPSAG